MFLCQNWQHAPGCSSDLLGHSDCYLFPVSLPSLNLSDYCGSLVPLSPLYVGWWLGKGTFNTPLFTGFHIERAQTQRALVTLGSTLKDKILESKPSSRFQRWLPGEVFPTFTLLFSNFQDLFL